jgi:hypothetical protein
LDDGEVGILLAGNNSILDPSLTPHMLEASLINYNVDTDAPSTDDEDDNDEQVGEDDSWFPSLRRLSSIHGLDDEDQDSWADTMATLFATNVEEYDTEDDQASQHPKKRKRHGHHGRLGKSRRIASGKDRKTKNHSDRSSSGDDDADGHLHIDFVPVDVVCVHIE